MNVNFHSVAQDPVGEMLDKKAVDEARKKSEQDPKQLKLSELKAIAQSFEALFMNMLTKSMRSTIHKSGFMNGGQGEKMFTELLDQQIASNAVKRGTGLGIAKMLIKRYGKHAANDVPGAVPPPKGLNTPNDKPKITDLVM